MCTLFYGIKTSSEPFAASLVGIHRTPPIEDEEELHLPDHFSFATFEPVPIEKSISLSSCEPSLYSLQNAPIPIPSRNHRSWLPPLKFEPPSEGEHPALQAIVERPSLARTQTPLLPAPINHNATPYRQQFRDSRDSSFDRSNTIATASSSTYSLSTSISRLSRNPSTLSSFSSVSCDVPVRSYSLTPTAESSEHDVPAIPERYRHPSHSSRNGDLPLRPGSRPALPPAGFWMYARDQQQKQNDILDTRRQTVWPDASPLRQSATISTMPRDARRPRYTLIPSPDKAVLRPNTNRGNVMQVRKRSYESLRKESVLDFGLESGENIPRSKVRDSRTLVKKRQPWDHEPRRGRQIIG